AAGSVMSATDRGHAVRSPAVAGAFRRGSRQSVRGRRSRSSGGSRRSAASGGPDGAVVGEVDQPGIELLEGIHPVRDAGQGLAVSIAVGTPGELVGGVLGR